MDDKINHTPLPWYVPGYHTALINSVEGSVASCVTIPDCEDEDAANAAFIVRACNSHYELLEALQFYVSICGNTAHSIDPQTAREMYDKGRAAIAKASDV